MTLDVPGGVVDPFSVLKLGPEMEGVPMPRAALRDEESLDTWPSTDLAGYLFKRDADREHREAIAHDLERWLGHLDEYGIAIVQVPIPSTAPNELFDRFAGLDNVFLSIRVDPHDGMKAVRRIRELSGRYPNVRSISISPHMLYPFIAPSDRGSSSRSTSRRSRRSWRCSSTSATPRHRVPAFTQDPAHLDEVCWFFPDLTVVMRHGGEPWVSTCVKMLLRWPNLYYATTAFAPRYYPAEIMHLLRTRGRDKVIWAGYWPMLSYDRLFREVGEYDLEPEVATSFFSTNARRAFRFPSLSIEKKEST